MQRAVDDANVPGVAASGTVSETVSENTDSGVKSTGELSRILLEFPMK